MAAEHFDEDAEERLDEFTPLLANAGEEPSLYRTLSV